MILRPRKFKFKNIHKRRKNNFYPRKGSLQYGQAGLAILQPIRLQNKHIFRLKLFLKKSARKADKTTRKLWFNAFPHIPVSKKPEGSRMGKGKGKLSTWVCEISGGVMLVELKNLRPGRAVYFLKQLKFRLLVETTIMSYYNYYIDVPNNKKRKISFFKIW